jgi:large subunit ribosomal protein L18
MNTKREKRMRRKLRIRARVNGTIDRPRLNVYRSNKSIYVQLVDDEKHATIFTVTIKGKTIAKAKELGALIVEKAKKKNITKIVFDRGGYRYHGVIKALADSVREGGLQV